MLRKFVAAAGLGFLAVLILAGPVMAGKAWCYRDPIVRLNGTDVQILVAVHEDDQWRVDGPVSVTVKAPKGTTREVIFRDAGFNGHGEEVRFGDTTSTVSSDGSFRINVTVEVSTDSSGSGSGEIPVLVTIIAPDGTTTQAEGTSDRTGVSLTISGP